MKDEIVGSEDDVDKEGKYRVTLDLKRLRYQISVKDSRGSLFHEVAALGKKTI